MHFIELAVYGSHSSTHLVSLSYPSLTNIPDDSVAPLALLLVTPVLLLGADYLFDELLKVHDQLRGSIRYRSLLYLILISVTLLILNQVSESDGYLDAFRITSGTIFQVIAVVIAMFFLAKWGIKRRWMKSRTEGIEKLELELPQYLEMFHILITSGMSVLSALKVLGEESGGIRPIRTATSKSSAMRKVIQEILQDVESGTSIEGSLDKVVMKAGSEQLRRFSDAVILGMERGSSMGQTLKNLIGETRNQSKILVMQRAGKAEIQLLIPVVFLILPISVMFAIWPSYVNLVSIMG